MPHQRGDHPLGFSPRNGHGLLRDAREAPPHSLHPGDIQRRRMGPMLVQHPSPGARHMHPDMHPGMYPGPHPHSPAWYGSAAVSPHRVNGSSLSVASGESLVGEHLMKRQQRLENVAVPAKKPSDELKEKHDIIHEALRRHMDDDNSIGTNEADAASALLFATGAFRKAESSKVSVAGSKGEGEGQEAQEADEKSQNLEERKDQGEEDEEQAESSGPLKKRRKLLDFLRKKPVTTATTEKQPLHVSPLPSPQVRTRVSGHESSEETAATASPQRTSASSSTSMTNSYDMKDTQCLHEGAKIKDAAEISPPPAQVIIEHFPTVLHNVLTNSDFAGSVVQWLEDGKAWKILRWDALRRKVLPKHFSQLQDEDGKVGSSIDAFMWHLASWGFEEVQSGPDVGAYTHGLFRKDLPQLCRQMTFAPKNEVESPTATRQISEKLKEASKPHSILQVPSLASAPSQSEAEGISKQAERTLQYREEQRNMGAVHSPTIAYHPSLVSRPMRHPEGPVFVNYRTGDVAYANEGWQYFPDSPMAMRHAASGLTAYEQRLLQKQPFEFGGQRTLALHSPRVQSGRGALRVATAGNVGLDKMERPMALRRASFPVSNRGKGPRGSPALQVRAMAKLSSEAQVKTEESAGLQKLSEEVAERVATAISKKTKRKLPLSSSSSTAVESSTKESEKESETKVMGV